jgi:hypothetical protein
LNKGRSGLGFDVLGKNKVGFFRKNHETALARWTHKQIHWGLKNNE